MEQDELIDSSTRTEAALILTPKFNFSLNHRVVPNCALLATLEPGTEPTLIAVSTSNKVIIKSNESTLNILDKIKCISCAPFGKGYDYLAIGTESQLILFDTYKNTTIFQKDIPDGVNCISVGILEDREPMIICGGNCAIWGFDETGADKYWTVTGDSVTTMCLCDYDDDGKLELIVGSPDYEIRIFKDDLMRSEIMETDAVTHLTAISKNRFVYSLANGTLGMYRKDQRLWRIKSKYVINTILNFPNQEDLFTCVWSNGKIDIRYINTNETLHFKVPEKAVQVASAFSHFNKEANDEEVTVISVDGKVLGYHLESKAEKVDKTQEDLRSFGQKKHNLLMELSNFEAEEQITESEKEKDRIPANTNLSSNFAIDYENRMLQVFLKTTNMVCITGVVAFAEGMFDGDSYIWIPTKFDGNGDEIYIPLLPHTDSENDISLRVFLGRPDKPKLFVFECIQHVPRFARFALVDEHPDYKTPDCHVEFILKTRTQRIHDWLQQSFIINGDKLNPEAVTVDAKFIELAPNKKQCLLITYESTEGKMTIHSESLETASNLIQSLANFVSIENLESTAVFPRQFKEIEEIVSEIDTMHNVKDRLGAELTDRLKVLKEVIIRAEDAIVLEDWDLTKRYFTRLKNFEREARQAFLLKTSNNERVLESLRKLNKIIENASKLRVGEPARSIVSACREAIANENKDIIVRILQFGA
ncbi:unnamed protein product [Auanema sp. JU1783]|nr:unnamed protein product [Auanema sp. JU1783]